MFLCIWGITKEINIEITYEYYIFTIYSWNIGQDVCHMVNQKLYISIWRSVHIYKNDIVGLISNQFNYLHFNMNGRYIKVCPFLSITTKGICIVNC